MINSAHKTVWVPQLPTRWDAERQLRMPTVDISAARNFGTVQYMLPDDVSSVAAGAALLRRLRNVSAAQMRADDRILCVGDPALIAAASYMAGWQRLPIWFLRWDRKARVYDALPFVGNRDATQDAPDSTPNDSAPEDARYG